MRAMSLSELEAPLHAQLVGQDREILGVSTDSRALQCGDLFVALSGENFDGHDYLSEVEAAGATAALVSCLLDSPLPQLQVANTQQALGRLGGHNRVLYKGPLVAITGSRSISGINATFSTNPLQTTGRREPLIGDHAINY